MAMIAAEQRGDAADDGHDALRVGRRDEQRHAAGDHVHAGRDHRRGVDQRADGRGAFHRVGQPDVQRELGALAARAEHQQQANRRGQPAADEHRRIAQPHLSQHAHADDRIAAGAKGIVEIERAVGGPDQETRPGRSRNRRSG